MLTCLPPPVAVAITLRDVLTDLRVTSDWVLSTLRERGLHPPDDLARGDLSAALSDDMVAVLHQHAHHGHAPRSPSRMPTRSPSNDIVDRILSDMPEDSRDQFRPVLENAVPAIISEVSDAAERDRLSTLRERLDILYEQEKKHLDLLKEYKEEIKFAHTMQEDLRRERSGFFAQTLKEVSATLQDAPVDKSVAADWVRELVRSYTASLDVSGDVIRTTALHRLGDLSEQSSDAQAKVERKPKDGDDD